MPFIDQWQASLDESLAQFAALASKTQDIDFAYVGAAVLWPLRVPVQDYDGEAIDAVREIAGQDAKHIFISISQWDDQPLSAAQKLADYAAEHDELRTALGALINHFNANDRFAELLVEKHLPEMAKAPQVIEQIKAALVNIGGITNIQSLTINLDIPTDTSETAPTFRPPRFAYPYPLQKHFRGRYQELESLSNWLREGDETIYTLIALGGMGKSALAWVWLLHNVLGEEIPSFLSDGALPIHQELTTFQGVFWWSFQGTEATFSSFLDEVLTYLDDKLEDSQMTQHEKVQRLLHFLQTERILLLLDNFEQELQAFSRSSVEAYEFDSEEDAPAGIRACITPYAATFLLQAASLPLDGRILITSRLFPAELDGLAGCHRENLQPLAPNDAKSFLIAHGVRGTDDEIRAVSKNYGYHPLTLRLIAGLVINDLVRPGYIEAIKDQKDRVLESQQEILALSYNSLSSSQQTLISRIAAFRANVDYSAILAINTFETEQLLQDNLRVLLERELLQFDQINRLYSMHPIVHQYAYARLVDKEGVHTKLRNYFATVPSPAKVEHLQDLSPVIELYHHTIQAGLYDDAWDIYNSRIRAPLYYNIGEYEYALQLLQAMPTDDSGKPPLNSKTNQIWWLIYQTMCYERTGQLTKGLKTAEKAMMWSRNADRPLALAQVQVPYTSLCCDTGQLDKAQKAIIESTSCFNGLWDRNWKGISNRTYSRVLTVLGQYEDAWKQFEITHKAYGEESRYTHGRSVLQAYKATWYLWQGMLEETVLESESAIALSEEGSFQREFIHASYLLGEALVHQAEAVGDEGQSQRLLLQAKQHLETALDRCRRIYLVELEAAVLLALAKWFTVDNDRKQAMSIAQEALELATDRQYRLIMSDACIFLAKMAQTQGDVNLFAAYIQQAKKHANYGSTYRYEAACQQIDLLQKDTQLNQ